MVAKNSEDKEAAFMTNREMIREMYQRTKNTEEMVGNMQGEISVLSTVQKLHAKDIDGLKTWRNVNISISGIISAVAAAIGFKG